MDSHQKCVLVDHNLCKVVVGRPDWNGPIAGKRCIWSADTDVKDVLGPSPSNEDIGNWGSSRDSDQDCGKESTGWMAWRVKVGRLKVGCELGRT